MEGGQCHIYTNGRPKIAKRVEIFLADKFDLKTMEKLINRYAHQLRKFTKPHIKNIRAKEHKEMDGKKK